MTVHVKTVSIHSNNYSIIVDISEIQIEEGGNLIKAMKNGRVCDNCFMKMVKGKLKCPGWHRKWQCRSDDEDCGILNNEGFGSIPYKTSELLQALKRQNGRTKKIGIQT